MNALIELLPHFDVSGGVLLGLLDATLKATFILTVAAILVVALRHAAARHRHAMLAVAVFSVLVVPLLSVVMPRYHVPLLPGPISDKPALNVIDSTQYSNNPISSALPTAPLVDRHSIGDISMTVATTYKLATDSTPVVQQPTLTTVSNTHAVSKAIQADTTRTAKQSTTAAGGISISLVLVVIWATGLLAGLLWMMLGTMRVSRWMRLGENVDDKNARRVMRQVTQGLGLRRHVALIETDAIDSPITWGAMRPVVLLPESWHEWNTERLRIVLLHELMHVRRNDWLVQMVARLACVVHWFNPLVWFVSRRLEEIRELACDDDVVEIGTRPSTYAQTLLEMATRMRRRPMIAAVALNMAARTRLEGRVVSILGHSRDGARRGLVLQGSLVGLAACALVLSAVEPWQVESTRRYASDSAPRRIQTAEASSAIEIEPELSGMRDVSTMRPTRFASAVGAWRSDSGTTARKSLDRLSDYFVTESTPSSMTPANEPVVLSHPNSGGSITETESPSGRLIDRANTDRLLLWQQMVAKYREVERSIRLAVLKNEFDAALQDTDRAMQLIESARSYAPSAVAFDDMIASATALRVFVIDESRRFNEEQNRILQAEIEAYATGKIDAIRLSRERIVAQLANRADELAKARQYDEAVQALDQLLLVDPDNQGALWRRGILNDLRRAVNARGAVRARHNETRDLMIANDWDGVPYHDDLRYPEDWPEKTSRRRSTDELREPESTRRARQRLRTAAPEIQFDAMTFEDVIDRLRAMTGLNIVPNWAAMEAVAIEKDAEVSLQLRDVSYEKTLDLILSEVSGGEVDLAYEIDEGILRISTKEDLSRRTTSVPIDVRDLLITIPTFRGPTIDISQVGQGGQQAGGIGGGRFIEGGGGGGGGGGQGQNPFQDAPDDDEDVDTDDALQPLIDLIQATIEPESWREAGGNVGSISTLNQMIVVTQTSSAQQQLQDL